jgi:hypothetical protein
LATYIPHDDDTNRRNSNNDGAFYSRLEVGLLKKIHGIRCVFAWANLIGMNVGDAAVRLAMIYTGLAGSSVLELIANGGASGL